MTAKEIIYGVIKSNENFSNIRLNAVTGKIELNGNNILSIDYDDILDKCKEDYPDTRFTKQLVKEITIKYARENKYEPETKRKHREDKSEWYAQLEFDKDDKPVKSLNNVIRFFKHYPYFKDKFYYNEFTQYEEYNNDLIRDFHISQFRSLCEKELGYESKDKVECAVQFITHENSFNPFKDKINELLWDGEERAESFFIDFIGVHDTILNRTLTRKWLYAMIKRLYEPGCPFDNMLIIYDSKQGTGKSKIIERLVYSLGVNYGYNTSITCDNKDKDNVDKLNKTWVVGIDEMNEFLKKNPEQTKQFLAQSSDQARLSYAKRSEIYKRHCVFYGNSNLEYFLKDYTSSFERRYWVMEADGEVHSSKWWNEHLTDEYCQQVIAEMKYFYDNNPDFNYTTLEIDEAKELEEIQFKHKTLNNDELLKYNIEKILDRKYNKIEFVDYEDFKNTVSIDNYYDDCNTTTTATDYFFGNEITEVNKLQQINKIPVKWLKMLVEEQLRRNVSTQYIGALLREKWEYKKCRYNNQSINCYSRK